MFVRIGGMGNEAVELKESALLEFLRGGNVNAKGEPKEEIEVFRSGFIFGPRGEKSDEPEGTPWVMSTFDLDRFGEAIDPEGWELRNFRANPVVQWAHDHRIPAIGRAENVEVVDGALRGRVIFNGREYDEFGWGIGERVSHGVIRAGSVGFLVLKVEFPDTKKASGGPSLIYRKQELLEFSACNVPALPFALADGGAGGSHGEKVIRSVIREMGKLEQEIADLKFRLFEDKLLEDAENGVTGEDGIWGKLIRGDEEDQLN